jgi:hypothetical protein
MFCCNFLDLYLYNHNKFDYNYIKYKYYNLYLLYISIFFIFCCKIQVINNNNNISYYPTNSDHNIINYLNINYNY